MISFVLLSKMGFNKENAKEAKEYIATEIEGVSLFIIIIPRIPYRLRLLKTFSKEQVGQKTI